MAYAWLLGVSHRSIEDDEYNGYFIPTNAAIGKLDSDVTDPDEIFFGLGRWYAALGSKCQNGILNCQQDMFQTAPRRRRARHLHGVRTTDVQYNPDLRRQRPPDTHRPSTYGMNRLVRFM